MENLSLSAKQSEDLHFIECRMMILYPDVCYGCRHEYAINVVVELAKPATTTKTL